MVVTGWTGGHSASVGGVSGEFTHGNRTRVRARTHPVPGRPGPSSLARAGSDVAIAPPRAVLTVTGVTATHDLNLLTETDPRSVFVDAKFLMARWGKKKSAFYEYIGRIDGFPGQVVHGRWRWPAAPSVQRGRCHPGGERGRPSL